MLRFIPVAFLVTLCTSTALPLAAQTDAPKPDPSNPYFPTNEQLRHFKTIGSPRIAPDGEHILIRVVDATADGAKGHLWLTGIHGEEPRQLTYSPETDKGGERAGEWMPDGQSILFLAKRGEHTALFRLPMQGGEAHAFELKTKPAVDESKLSDALPPKSDLKEGAKEGAKPDANKQAAGEDELPLDVSSYAVSPDGKWIAVVADDPQTPGEKAQKEAKADATWVDHDPHGARLYLVDVANGKVTPVALEPDVREPVWSADGSKLLVLTEGMNNAGDLAPAGSSWVVSLADGNRVEKLAALPPTVEAAAWSLYGKQILYLAQAKADAPPGYADLYRYDLATQAIQDLSDGLKGSVGRGGPLPLADGSVVQLLDMGFRGKVGRYGLGAKDVGFVEATPHFVTDISTNAARNGWLFLSSSGGSPETLLYSRDLQSPATPVKLPALAPERILSVAPKQIEWKSDGWSVEGRLYLPPDAGAKKVPLIVEVHGGPLGAYADAYEPWVDFLLGQGWAVLRTNPRGSSGYGAAFAAANKNDLGGGDYRDIMAGVDAVLKTEPVDGSRMALMGYSYGGEMAAFVEGKTTRFKAIVSGAPVIDQNSEYGTESGSWYDRWYFGKPWEHPADAWRQSPLAAAGKAKTPFLLLQGEGDTTDPLGQSQEMYRALRQMGVPVDLVTYPRDNHGPLAMALYGYPVTEPWHGFDARRRVVAFIQKAFDGGGK